MSILIKNMTMPKNCVDCRFHKGIYCTLTDICTNTAQGCPLIEVLPHGRLIDADALDDLLMKLADNEYTPKVFASWLSYEENAPTIIPAESEE